MNYFNLINNFEIIKYEYPDLFDIKLYYVDNYNCKIIVNRLDSDAGWGLILQIKIFDFYDTNLFNIITFGNSEDNSKVCDFNTTILLQHDFLVNSYIPNFIQPRNDFLIGNKYKIINNDNIDLHVVIYYLDKNMCKIILRRLDDENGWNNDLKIIIYENNIKEYISIGKSEINYKFLIKTTKLKLTKIDHNYTQEIPKIIFQTGSSKFFKNILHYNSIMSFIELNPEYTYYYFDDILARKFLNDNFSNEINYSYDLLVPGAFKADLLRYCFLHNNGGCYFDCKQILRVPIRDFLESNRNFLVCNDVIEDAFLNAIIFSTEKNFIIKKTIKDCVYNIINKSGNTALDITGPIFFYKSINNIINKNDIVLQNHRPINNFYDFSEDYINNNVKLINNNKIILNRFYKNYYQNYLDTKHYGKLFNDGEIYYKNFQNLNHYKLCVYPNNYPDKFLFIIEGNKLIIKRIDSHFGWYFNLKILIIYENYNERLIEIGESMNNIKEVFI
jgi:mannosyltransferase OCH1-like enzyme